MARKLPATDVVIVGLGWTGSILAHELAGSGLNIIAIERGPWRDTATDFAPAYAQDELRYHIRHDLFLRPAQLTMTFRNSVSETALPIRSWGSFMPPNGVGGGGVHWNAETWRFLPSDFQMKTQLTERYGEKFLPSDMTIQDWGITYDELEPYYEKFEYLCGMPNFVVLKKISPRVRNDSLVEDVHFSREPAICARREFNIKPPRSDYLLSASTAMSVVGISDVPDLT
jgi:gluconate 2-dehydrogenase alpha chain